MGAELASVSVGARPVSILTIVDTDIRIDAGQDVQEVVECLAKSSTGHSEEVST